VTATSPAAWSAAPDPDAHPACAVTLVVAATASPVPVATPACGATLLVAGFDVPVPVAHAALAVVPDEPSTVSAVACNADPAAAAHPA
jgi:hypothetical protein